MSLPPDNHTRTAAANFHVYRDTIASVSVGEGTGRTKAVGFAAPVEKRGESRMPENVRARVFRGDAGYELQEIVDARFADGRLQSVLDAGCGFQLPIDLPHDVHLVGIDVSDAALERNNNVDEKIVGDIQSYPLPPEAFDAVICWWVLEHVPHPRMAIVNIAGALRREGDFIIGIPHLWSIKGILTKLTPHRFHVWVYSRIFRLPDVGAPGVGPFHTYLHRDLSPGRLSRIMAGQGFDLVHERFYGDAPEPLPRPLRSMWRLVGKFAKLITAGRWKALEGEYVAVYRKRA